MHDYFLCFTRTKNLIRTLLSQLFSLCVQILINMLATTAKRATIKLLTNLEKSTPSTTRRATANLPSKKSQKLQAKFLN